MDKSDTLNTHVLAELECPVCTDYMAPPIRMCDTGHSICEFCMKKISQCPLCQKQFINAKNLCLQALAYKVSYPCTNQSLGCDEKLKLEQKENHEKKCWFRRFKCAMEKCNWTGSLGWIVDHWKLCKRKNYLHDSNSKFETNLATATAYVSNMACAFDQLFWIKRKKDEEGIYWAVQLIGPEPADNAPNYYYEIEVYESKSSQRRIILKDYCKSIDIENNDLLSTNVCLTTVTDECLQHFTDSDQSLNYSVRIYKV